MSTVFESDRSTDAPEGNESAIRVAFFSDAFPERNGTGAYYHDLIAQLEGKVGAVAIFQPKFCSEHRPLLSIAMPGDAGQRLETPPLRRIRRACDELSPNVVVVVTPGLYGLLGVYEARRSNAVLLSAFHTDFEQLVKMYWSRFTGFFARLIVRTANSVICRSSRSVFINNEALRGDVLKLGAKRVDVIGTPLPRPFLSRDITDIPNTLQRVCFAGRLAPEKNVHHILDAARDHPDIEFLIGGNGPLRERLEEQANAYKNVRFLGWLNREELVALIDDSSLLLLPSAFETFGSIALEAMARGRPALVSANAGIQAWPSLQPGLFKLNRPENLSDVLTGLKALSPQEWQQKSATALDAAKTLNQETVGHWLELLGEHPQSLLNRER